MYQNLSEKEKGKKQQFGRERYKNFPKDKKRGKKIKCGKLRHNNKFTHHFFNSTVCGIKHT